MSKLAYQLSQNSLKIWQTCQRKFRYLYIDELRFPTATQGQGRLEKGKQFHLILQQQRLGIDVEPLVKDDPELLLWLDNYYNYPPALIEGKEYLEIYRSCQLAGVKLLGVYDLLIVGDRQGQIVDWKTHRTPIKPELLRQDWQTKLYLYLLQVTTNLSPENLSMTYWFANSPQNNVIINYNQSWHDQIHRELLGIITEMTHEKEYPTLFPDSKVCQGCEFKYRCFDQPSDSITIDAIPEISI